MQNLIKNYITRNYDNIIGLLRSFASYPAPSGKEEKRALFCLEWLKSNGAESAYIDDVNNVIYPYNCENSDSITVVSAHTDTVFPDTEPMDIKEDEEKIYYPGVGDDTSNVCVLLYSIKFFIENNISFNKGILFVLNSCEEGLGNLKGIKAIMQKFGDRVTQFVDIDSKIGNVYDRCVGSHRYEVEVKTEGGHSFQKFGNPNAIAKLSEIIYEIYKIKVPVSENKRTTYNVGTIEGGTSVNTIAQSAKMLCEYRSDDVEALSFMEEKFSEIFESAKKDGVEVSVNRVGVRPCEKDVDINKKNALAKACCDVANEVTGKEIILKSASTDCNIPLSMGVPAVCIGAFSGEGAHTREEWIEKLSLKTGIEIVLKTILKICGKY